VTANDDEITTVIAPLYAIGSNITRVVAGKPMVTRLAILQAVAHSGTLRPSEIATGLHLHQSQVTRLIQALESEGLVTVTANPDDRRSWFVGVTEAGHAEIDQLTEVGMAKWRQFFAGWDAAEVTELGRLLAKLQSSINDVVTPSRGTRT
jgi:DNA-binding MarR family transcriptional regulator